MENLALHIEYLLLRHDCIIVPGFGAFIKVMMPAKLDTENGKWHPMTSEIRFNSAINNDDALLTNSYSRKYSLSYQEARNLLDREISELSHQIDIEGESTLGNLGVLRKSGTSIQFLPLSSCSKSSYELGFHPITDPVEIGTNEKIIDKPSFLLSNSSENIAKNEDGNKRDNDKYYHFKINKITAKLAVSLLLLLVVALSIFLPIERSSYEDRASILPVDSVIPTKNSTYTSSAPTNVIEKLDKEDNNLVSENISVSNPEPETINANELRYFLIVGTFRSEAEADRYVEINSKEGYDLEIIPSKTLYRVSAKASSDKNNLIKELNSTEFRNLFPEAWIWKK